MGKVPGKKKETGATLGANRVLPPLLLPAKATGPSCNPASDPLNKSDITLQTHQSGWEGRAGPMSASEDSGASCSVFHIHQARKEGRHWEESPDGGHIQATWVQGKSLPIYEFFKETPGCYSERKAQAMAMTGLGFGSQPPWLNKWTFARHNVNLGGKLLLESNTLLL